MISVIRTILQNYDSSHRELNIHPVCEVRASLVHLYEDLFVTAV